MVLHNLPLFLICELLQINVFYTSPAPPAEFTVMILKISQDFFVQENNTDGH